MRFDTFLINLFSSVCRYSAKANFVLPVGLALGGISHYLGFLFWLDLLEMARSKSV